MIRTRLSKIRSVLGRWFTPRATDRDEAFRERVIRTVLAIIILGDIANLMNSLLLYQNEWAVISFPSVHIYALILFALVAYAIQKGKVVIAGWLMTLTVLIAVSLFLLLGLQEGEFVTVIYGQTGFLIVPLLTAIILPRNNILTFTFLTAVFYGGFQFLYPTQEIGLTGFSASSQLTSIILLLALEGILLRQFRLEFDKRLYDMSVSIEQERLAKLDAEQARQQAERADQAKSQFLANMSHELRTPLNAIIGYDEAMLGGMVGDFTPKQRQLLEYIQYNSRRLLGLINDILDLSKIVSGGVQVYTAPVVLPTLFRDTIASLQSLVDKRPISLNLEIGADAPEVIISDAKRLEQILTNLVSNSVKFTNEGGVYVCLDGMEDKWSFTVRDTGIGIPKDSLEAIFEPFHQVDNSMSRKFKGTGLGLSITQKLVETLGGAIELQSEVNQGTTFTIVFPRTMPAHEKEVDLTAKAFTK